MALGEICQRIEPLGWRTRVSAGAGGAAGQGTEAASSGRTRARVLNKAYRASILGRRLGILTPNLGAPEGEHRQVKEASGRLHVCGPGVAAGRVGCLWAAGGCKLRPFWDRGFGTERAQYRRPVLQAEQRTGVERRGARCGRTGRAGSRWSRRSRWPLLFGGDSYNLA